VAVATTKNVTTHFPSPNSSVIGVRFPAWLGIFSLPGQNIHIFFWLPRD